MSAALVIPGQSRDEYDASRRVNWSTLRHIARSPQHYLHALRAPHEETDAMRLGSAVHTAILEPETFPERYVVWTGGRRYGKAWDDFCAEHAGRDILTQAQYEQCVAMQAAVHAHPVAAGLVRGGQAEVSVEWTDSETGIECKGRIDYIREDCIVDLKTARDASPDGFGRAAWNLDYIAQLAWYRDGYAAATGRELPVRFIVVENSEPHVVAVYDMPEHILEIGRETYEDLLGRLQECQRSGRWPGYSDEAMELELPRWALGSVREDEDLTGLDLEIGE